MITRRALFASLAAIPALFARRPMPTIPLDLRDRGHDFPPKYGLRDANLGHRGNVTIDQWNTDRESARAFLACDLPLRDISKDCIRCNDEEGWADVYAYHLHAFEDGHQMFGFKQGMQLPFVMLKRTHNRRPLVVRLRGRVVFTPFDPPVALRFPQTISERMRMASTPHFKCGYNPDAPDARDRVGLLNAEAAKLHEFIRRSLTVSIKSLVRRDFESYKGKARLE